MMPMPIVGQNTDIFTDEIQYIRAYDGNQIFKFRVPQNILIDLFEKIAHKCENYYVINYNSYKKGIYTGDIQKFIEHGKHYYHSSKLWYLNRKMNYNNFITVMRQFCNYLNYKYDSQIKYDRSTYDIVYHVYTI